MNNTSLSQLSAKLSDVIEFGQAYEAYKRRSSLEREKQKGRMSPDDLADHMDNSIRERGIDPESPSGLRRQETMIKEYRRDVLPGFLQHKQNVKRHKTRLMNDSHEATGMVAGGLTGIAGGIAGAGYLSSTKVGRFLPLPMLVTGGLIGGAMTGANVGGDIGMRIDKRGKKNFRSIDPIIQLRDKCSRAIQFKISTHEDIEDMYEGEPSRKARMIGNRIGGLAGYLIPSADTDETAKAGEYLAAPNITKINAERYEKAGKKFDVERRGNKSGLTGEAYESPHLVTTVAPTATSYGQVTDRLKKQNVGFFRRHGAAIGSIPVRMTDNNAAFLPVGSKGVITTPKESTRSTILHEEGHAKDYAHHGGRKGFDKAYPKYGNRTLLKAEDYLRNTMTPEVRAWEYAQEREDSDAVRKARRLALNTYETHGAVQLKGTKDPRTKRQQKVDNIAPYVSGSVAAIPIALLGGIAGAGAFNAAKPLARKAMNGVKAIRGKLKFSAREELNSIIEFRVDRTDGSSITSHERASEDYKRRSRVRRERADDMLQAAGMAGTGAGLLQAYSHNIPHEVSRKVSDAGSYIASKSKHTAKLGGFIARNPVKAITRTAWAIPTVLGAGALVNKVAARSSDKRANEQLRIANEIRHERNAKMRGKLYMNSI